MKTSIMLTTLEVVKRRLAWEDVDYSDDDDLLNDLIAESSSRIESWCGREFAKKERTEYHDGNGRHTLNLDQGPIDTSAPVVVAAVVYQSDGAGGREEVLSTIAPHEYVEDGRADGGHVGRGKIRLLTSRFVCGTLNYKVTYTAGFHADDPLELPEAVRHAATNYVAAKYLARAAEGLTSKSLDDGSIDPIPLANLDLALDRSIGPYRVLGAY